MTYRAPQLYPCHPTPCNIFYVKLGTSNAYRSGLTIINCCQSTEFLNKAVKRVALLSSELLYFLINPHIYQKHLNIPDPDDSIVPPYRSKARYE